MKTQNRIIYFVLFGISILLVATSLYYIYKVFVSNLEGRTLNESNQIGLGVYVPSEESDNFSSISDFRISAIVKSLPRSFSTLKILKAISSSVEETITITHF